MGALRLARAVRADMNNDWARLGSRVHQTRLAFCDVTIGLVAGSGGVLVIDCGTTLAEARGIDADVRALTRRKVGHVLVTHNHFDHVLGSSAFTDAVVYAAPQVCTGLAGVREDALRHGADPSDVDAAVAALRPPDRQIREAVLDLGDLGVQISHPGRGHTDHDLIAVIPPSGPHDRTVVFCGDLVEESGNPAIGPDSDLAAWPQTLDRLLDTAGPDAIYVPGHGAPVDAPFVRAQRDWLAGCEG